MDGRVEDNIDYTIVGLLWHWSYHCLACQSIVVDLIVLLARSVSSFLGSCATNRLGYSISVLHWVTISPIDWALFVGDRWVLLLGLARCNIAKGRQAGSSFVDSSTERRGKRIKSMVVYCHDDNDEDRGSVGLVAVVVVLCECGCVQFKRKENDVGLLLLL